MSIIQCIVGKSGNLVWWKGKIFKKVKNHCLATLVLPFVQNVPGKVGEASSASCPDGNAVHRGRPRSRWRSWLHLRPCLVPSWCGASRTIWYCCWSWGISCPPIGLLPPQQSPEKKRAWKWIKKWTESHNKNPESNPFKFPFKIKFSRLYSQLLLEI